MTQIQRGGKILLLNILLLCAVCARNSFAGADNAGLGTKHGAGSAAAESAHSRMLKQFTAKFETASIRQRTPLIDACNHIFVTLEVDTDVPAGSTFTVSGLTGTAFADDDSLLVNSTMEGTFSSQGNWVKETGSLSVVVDTAFQAFEERVFFFEVKNPSEASASPVAVSISGELDTGHVLAETLMTTSNVPVMNVPDGSDPLVTEKPEFVTVTMEQTNPLAGASNQLHFAIRLNTFLPDTSRLQVLEADCIEPVYLESELWVDCPYETTTSSTSTPAPTTTSSTTTTTAAPTTTSSTTTPPTTTSSSTTSTTPPTTTSSSTTTTPMPTTTSSTTTSTPVPTTSSSSTTAPTTSSTSTTTTPTPTTSSSTSSTPAPTTSSSSTIAPTTSSSTTSVAPTSSSSSTPTPSSSSTTAASTSSTTAPPTSSSTPGNTTSGPTTSSTTPPTTTSSTPGTTTTGPTTSSTTPGTTSSTTPGSTTTAPTSSSTTATTVTSSSSTTAPATSSSSSTTPAATSSSSSSTTPAATSSSSTTTPAMTSSSSTTTTAAPTTSSSTTTPAQTSSSSTTTVAPTSSSSTTTPTPTTSSSSSSTPAPTTSSSSTPAPTSSSSTTTVAPTSSSSTTTPTPTSSSSSSSTPAPTTSSSSTVAPTTSSSTTSVAPTTSSSTPGNTTTGPTTSSTTPPTTTSSTPGTTTTGPTTSSTTPGTTSSTTPGSTTTAPTSSSTTATTMTSSSSTTAPDTSSSSSTTPAATSSSSTTTPAITSSSSTTTTAAPTTSSSTTTTAAPTTSSSTTTTPAPTSSSSSTTVPPTSSSSSTTAAPTSSSSTPAPTTSSSTTTTTPAPTTSSSTTTTPVPTTSSSTTTTPAPTTSSSTTTTVPPTTSSSTTTTTTPAPSTSTGVWTSPVPEYQCVPFGFRPIEAAHTTPPYALLNGAFYSEQYRRFLFYNAHELDTTSWRGPLRVRINVQNSPECNQQAPTVRIRGTADTSDDGEFGGVCTTSIDAVTVDTPDRSLMGIDNGAKPFRVVPAQFPLFEVRMDNPYFDDSFPQVQFLFRTNADAGPGSFIVVDGLTALNNTFPNVSISSSSNVFDPIAEWSAEEKSMTFTVSDRGFPARDDPVVVTVDSFQRTAPIARSYGSATATGAIEAGQFDAAYQENRKAIQVDLERASAVRGLSAAQDAMGTIVVTWSRPLNTGRFGTEIELSGYLLLAREDSTQIAQDVGQRPSGGQWPTTGFLVNGTDAEATDNGFLMTPGRKIEISVQATNFFPQAGGPATAMYTVGELPCLDYCGDGRRVLQEECDDANSGDGDGCSSNCTIEAGFVCWNDAPDFPCRTAQNKTSGLSTCAVPTLQSVFVFESTDLPGTPNEITVAIQSSVPVLTGQKLTFTGLTGSTTANTGTLAIDNLGNPFASTGAWTRTAGRLVVETTGQLEANVSHSLIFTLSNPTATQSAVPVTVECAGCALGGGDLSAVVSSSSVLGVVAIAATCESPFFGADCAEACSGVVQGDKCRCPPGRFGHTCSQQAVKSEVDSVPPTAVARGQSINLKSPTGAGVRLGAGALQEDVVISANAYDVRVDVAEDQNEFEPLSLVMDCKPDLKFLEGVELAIPVDLTAVAAEQSRGRRVQLAFFNTTRARWQIQGGFIDRVTGHCKAFSNHFSLWTTMSVPPPPEPTVAPTTTPTPPDATPGGGGEVPTTAPEPTAEPDEGDGTWGLGLSNAEFTAAVVGFSVLALLVLCGLIALCWLCTRSKPEPQRQPLIPQPPPQPTQSNAYLVEMAPGMEHHFTRQQLPVTAAAYPTLVFTEDGQPVPPPQAARVRPYNIPMMSEPPQDMLGPRRDFVMHPPTHRLSAPPLMPPPERNLGQSYSRYAAPGPPAYGSPEPMMPHQGSPEPMMQAPPSLRNSGYGGYGPGMYPPTGMTGPRYAA